MRATETAGRSARSGAPRTHRPHTRPARKHIRSTAQVRRGADLRDRPTPPGRRGGSRAAWLLLSPAGLVMVAFTVAPVAFLVYTSFTDYNQRTLFTGAYSVVGWGVFRPPR